jgi:polysaccharide deacetylase family protein (PEP-CTERM system associated)
VRRLLDLIAEDACARTTFFVLGKLALRHPNVVRAIQSAGHEVACHGFGHVRVGDLGRAGFQHDLRRAKGILSDITGEPVAGFRAPVFSITRDTLWALEILADEGFRYDSSIFPFNGSRYGIRGWPSETHRLLLEAGRRLTEFPLTVTTVAGRSFPIAGGGYARLLPASWLVRLFKREAVRRTSWPVFYCHPYEIDPEEFRRTSPRPRWGVLRPPLRLRLHQGIGRRGFDAKLRVLLRRFRFRSCLEALGADEDLPQFCPGITCGRAGRTEMAGSLI